MKFLHYILQLILLSCLAGLVQCQTFCSGDKSFCLYSSDNGTNTLLTIVVKSTKIKWAGIGFGSGMIKAEIYIAYNTTSGFVVSRRASNARIEPKAVSNQVQQLITDPMYTGQSGPGVWFVSFTRPKAAISANNVEVDITASSQPMIWAVGTTVTGNDASAVLNKHFYEDSPVANLYASTSKFDPSLFTNATSVVSDTGSDPRMSIIIHGILMFVAWQILSPAGVFVARFGKAKLGVWWFRIHVAVMILGVGSFMIAGFVIGYNVVGDDHFDMQKYSTKSGIHVVFGLIVLILMLVQMVGGYIIDYLWNPKRTGIPWWDKFHWYAGRFLYLLTFVNIPLGFYLFEVDYEEKVNVAIWIMYFVWAIGVVGVFFWMNKRSGQVHHLDDKPAEP